MLTFLHFYQCGKSLLKILFQKSPTPIWQQGNQDAIMALKTRYLRRETNWPGLCERTILQSLKRVGEKQFPIVIIIFMSHKHHYSRLKLKNRWHTNADIHQIARPLCGHKKTILQTPLRRMSTGSDRSGTHTLTASNITTCKFSLI